MNFISRRLPFVAFLAFAITTGFAQTEQPAAAPQTTAQQPATPAAAAPQVADPPTAAPQAASPEKSSGTSIAIIIDDSDAARKQFSDLRDGVLAFDHSFGEEDELCLIGIGMKPHMLQELTYDPTLIDEAVKKVHPVGAPDIVAALQYAKEQLQSEAENDNSAIVLFVGNQSNINVDARALTSQTGGKIPVNVIASPGADWQLQEKLQELTASSGGRAYFPPTDKQFREAATATGLRLTARKSVVATKENKPSAKWVRDKKLLAGYQELTVRSIPVAENKDTEQFMGGDNLLLQRVLVERLKRAKIFPAVIDASSTREPMNVNTAVPGEPGKKLEMRATMVKYDRGSRMRRQFTFGGDARIALQVDLEDAVTGENVESFATEGSAYMGGVFGGSEESVLAKAMLDVANKVLREMQRQR